MFIDQETLKRVNIYAPYKGRSRLDSQEIRAAVGVVEIADPVRESEETHYNQEIDDPPYLICTPKSPELLAGLWQERLNQESLAYLAATDWMVIRSFEKGEPLPDGVADKRQGARDAIVIQAK